MNTKYVAKVILPYTEETNAGEEGPFINTLNHLV